LDAQPPGRLLVQYVPHAFGWKAMNVPLCMWLARQRRHALWVMFHEVAFPLEAGQPWRHTFLAHVTRWMARKLAESAERVLMSTDSWSRLLNEICGRRVKADWSPIPSNFEGCLDALQREGGKASADLKAGTLRIGHFGTFGQHIAEPLAAIIPAIAERCPDAEIHLIGRGSIEFCQRLEKLGVVPKGRLHATGEMEPLAISRQLLACDLLIQPFPDGVSTRRTSAMCGLALGFPMITQRGALTESIWQESGAVRLVNGASPEAWASAVWQLLDSKEERARLGEAARALYQQRFSLARTIDLLRAWDIHSKAS
jgi:glycosyltransferase involved in cell wall biosynthesis